MKSKKKKKQWTYIENRNRPTDIKNKLMVTKGEKGDGDKLGVWDEQVHTIMPKIGDQQEFTM